MIPALTFLLFFLLSPVSTLTAGGTTQQQGKTFTWTIALENIKSGDMVPFSAPVQAKRGEEFCLVINPNAGCFCYVIAESSANDDVTVLYNGPLNVTPAVTDTFRRR